MRKTEFANEEYYHIYNRGVGKREVFLDDRDYVRFLIGMNEFNNEQLVGSLRDKQKIDKQIDCGKQKLSFGNSRSLASVSRFRLVEIIV